MHVFTRINQRGYSLPEILAAIVIIGTTTAVVTQHLQQGNKTIKRIEERNACDAYINTVNQRLRSVGQRLSIELIETDPAALKDIQRMFTDPVNMTIPSGSFPNIIDNTTIAKRNPDTPSSDFEFYTKPVNPGDQLEFRGAHLYNSTITALAAIYNANDYCTDFRAYADRDLLPDDASFLGTNVGMSNLQPQIRIEPVSLTNGASLGCPANLIIKPQANDGLRSYKAAFVNNVAGTQYEAGALWGGTNINSGSNVIEAALRVSIRLDYTDSNGDARRCEGQVRYQYAPDYLTSEPTNLNQMDVDTGGAGIGQLTGAAALANTGDSNVTTYPNPHPDPPVAICDPTLPGGSPGYNTQASVTFNLYYNNAASLEAGLLLICRDQSRMIDTGTVASCRGPGGSPPPELAVGGTKPVPVWQIGAYGTPGPYFTDQEYVTTTGSGAISAQHPAVDPSWRDCQNVTVCGVGPPTVTMGPGPPHMRLNLEYNNLPENCLARLEYAWLDTAGNITQARTIDHIVRTRACGVYCDGTSYGLPTDYYYCGPTGACP